MGPFKNLRTKIFIIYARAIRRRVLDNLKQVISTNTNFFIRIVSFYNDTNFSQNVELKRKWGTFDILGPKRISPKVGILNFIEEAFFDFDYKLSLKSSIYTLCGPLGPIVDATVEPTLWQLHERIRVFKL